MTFHSRLIKLLESNPAFVDDNGELLLNVVQDRAWKNDHDLIKLLLTDNEIKAKFFEEIAEHWIFNINTFIKYITQKDFLDNSYTHFRNQVGLAYGDKYLIKKGEISLIWPYKDCFLEGGQTKDEETRNEIFFNEILAQDEINRILDPKVITNFKRFTKNGQERVLNIRRDDNDIIRENILIKGNNLLALHTLVSQYRGQIKCIYIDPPFNPESKSNTFAYNNNFNHSTWLTFMKNRLEIAKEFLSDDGALIVAIDDNEVFFLGVLLTEIFSDYEIHCITIVHNPRGVQGNNFSYTHEYAFFVFPKGKKVIGDKKIKEEDIDWAPLRNWGGESLRADAKNCFYPIIVENEEIIGFGEVLEDDEHPISQTINRNNKFFVYPIDKNGIERKWRYARQSIDEIKHLLRVKKTKSGYDIELGKDFGVYRTVWEDSRYDANAYGTQLVKTLVPNSTFNFPKSLWNIYDCLYAVVGNDKNAIILDFFAGSGTTAHAVIELNKDGGQRNFILCEQMSYVDTITKERIRRVIEENQKGNFIYCELMRYNEIFVDLIQDAKNNQELLEIWQEMSKSSFLKWYINPEYPEEALKDFLAIGNEKNGFKKQKKLLIELLDKNQLYVNLTEIEDKQYKVTVEDKTLNESFFKNINV